ncbi:MAG: hypothetical protein ACLFVD_05970 [Dehalococcoidia bacterium]
MVEEQIPDQNQLASETKQSQREKRRAKEKAKMAQHGKGLARVYRDAVSKRTKSTRRRKQSS